MIGDTVFHKHNFYVSVLFSRIMAGRNRVNPRDDDDDDDNGGNST